jgi:DNA mismatch repair protein MutS
MARVEIHAWYRQYRKLKEQAADAILLFRFGDFYETFDDDAKLVAELLDVTLTRKDYAVDKSQPKDSQKLYAPMAGMPYHAVERYVSDLVGRGYRIAIAEQLTETESTRTDTRPRSVFATGIQHAAPGEIERKMVHREIVRVITPGTVIDGSMLAAATNNYLAAAIVEEGAVGLAYADLSTGEFACVEFGGERAATQLQGELARLQAAEVLVPDAEGLRLPHLAPAQAQLTQDLAFMTKSERELLLPHERVARRLEGQSEARWAQGHITAWPAWRWDLAEASEVLMRQLKVGSLAAFGLNGRPLAARAAGALLQYVHETQRHQAPQLNTLRVYSTGSFMFLDPQTRRNLELLEPNRQGSKTALVSVLDRTRTPMGARLLRRWIAQPLLELEPLLARQSAVAQLVDNSLLRAEIREALGQVGDMERALNRLAQGTTVATPRDLVQLRASLRAIPAVIEAGGEGLGELLVEGTGAHSEGAGHKPQGAANGPFLDDEDDDLFGDAPSGGPALSPVPSPLPPQLDPCADILVTLERALDDDPPALLGASNYLRSVDEGGEKPRRVIRPGFEPRIDALVKASRHAQEFIDKLEGKERERTGIRSLKVGYNSVFGYYIEVSRSADEKLIPRDYERKQTLVGAERYITAELKEYEQIIDRARLQLADLEREAFTRLCELVAAQVGRLRLLAQTIARLDTLASLADAAVRGRYSRPSLDTSTRLSIVGGRHPVVERMIEEEFVANDMTLDAEAEQLLIITGPNMAGKSTVLRQTALIVLMAQIGSFVPAERAEVGLADRIFTRIGAQDDIATGQSTFMVEMTETAALLLQSSRRSLIILDEVGRGTSTYDGMAIARAVVEYIHNEPRLRCRTLFATHYHELTALEGELQRVRNFHMAAVEQEGQVVFLHELRAGGADRSYGIHVAELAGIPRPVIARASELLAELEGRNVDDRRPTTSHNMNGRAEIAGQNDEQTVESFNRPAAAARRSSVVGRQSSAIAQTPPQLSLFEAAPSPVLEYLRRLRLNELTPLEALIKLSELQKLAGEE